ncbi:MAG TPA: hypothetical protein VIX37_17545 [Candidatus Sulfotelmatobacter sp.]
MLAVSFRATLFCLLTLGSAGALAQTPIDDVHITPREKTVDVATAGYPSARAGGALLRTSVNLVLVPGSITDGLNRPVVGLDQENFQLFENKKPQQIKHFSSEGGVGWNSARH